MSSNEDMQAAVAALASSTANRDFESGLSNLKLFYSKKAEEFISPKPEDESFFAALVALTVNYIVDYHSSGEHIEIQFESILDTVVEFLLQRVKTTQDSVISIITVTKSASLLKSLSKLCYTECDEDDMIYKTVLFSRLSDKNEGEERQSDSVDGIACGDFLSQLLSPQKSDSRSSVYDEKRRAGFTAIMSKAFHAANGVARLVEGMKQLVYLTKHVDAASRLLNGSGLTIPSSKSDVELFSKEHIKIREDMEAVLEILSTPLLYSDTDKTLAHMPEIRRIMLACVHVASYATVCCTLNTPPNTELEKTACSLAQLSTKIVNCVRKTQRGDDSLSVVQTNINTQSAWLILQTLQVLIEKTDELTKSASRSGYWTSAAVSLTQECLSHLKHTALESKHEHSTTMPSTAHTSLKLANAQKLLMSKYKLAEPYKVSEQFQFVTSGLKYKLPTVLCLVSANLVEVYKELIGSTETQEQTTTVQPEVVLCTPSDDATRVNLSQQLSLEEDGMLDRLFCEEEPLETLQMESSYSIQPDAQASNITQQQTGAQYLESSLSLLHFMNTHIIHVNVLQKYTENVFKPGRSLHAINALASLVNAISIETADDGLRSLQKNVKQLFSDMLTQETLDREAQSTFLTSIGLFADRMLPANWPMYVHPVKLFMLLNVVKGWSNEKDWDVREEMIVDMWNSLLASIHSECLTATTDGQDIEDVNVEHMQTMLSLIYTLLAHNRIQIFSKVIKTIIEVMQSARDQLVTMVPLPVTRLFMMLEYMLTHMVMPSENLMNELSANIVENNTVISYLAEGEIQKHYTDQTTNKNARPVFYKLYRYNRYDNLDSFAMTCIQNEDEYGFKMEDFYKVCLDGLLVGSCLDKAKAADKLTWFDSCCTAYHAHVVWRVLDILPPPVTFLLQMNDVHTLETQPAAVQALRLARKFREEEFVESCESNLRGAVSPSEIKGMIDNIISKTESPMYDVEITLHMLQAQMAVMMFGSQDEVIPSDNMPGFHTVVTLDIVLSHLHTSIVNYINQTDGDLKERLAVIEKCAEKLMPALNLLTGSLTQFVRSCFVHRVLSIYDQKEANLDRETSFEMIISQLNSISSSHESRSEMSVENFLPTAVELGQTLSEWKAVEFENYPSIENLSTDYSAGREDGDAFTTSVLHASCEALCSSSQLAWYTDKPLRHLHRTIVKLICDIYKYLQMKKVKASVLNEDELERIFIPLLYDGSCTGLNLDEIMNCLSDVFTFTKAVEMKYLYLLKKWYTLMLDLNKSASMLSKTTCNSLVMTFSHFIESCLEHPTKQVVERLSDFFTTKADLSALLLVTGMPGCSDMLSINRILKIFTKLISLAGSEKTGPHAAMLKSLNSLINVKEGVLSQWLLKIVMATPSEQSASDTAGQVQNNAMLLHNIADYMVRDDSLIERRVPNAILESLILVASQVLHQTLNAQGFQELMLVMSTLSRAGGSLKLFEAVVIWIEACIPYLTNDNSTLRPKTYELYSQLACCLLNYIDHSLNVVMGKPMNDLEGREEVTEVEDEGDSADAGRDEALDTALCTFIQTQRDFKTQHWYHCYTCNMTDGVGVCSICVKVCHRDHDVSYAKYGSFFCDCGAKEDGSCIALKKRSGSAGQAKITQYFSPQKAAKQPEKNEDKMLSTQKQQKANIAFILKENRTDLIELMEKEGLSNVISKLLQAMEPDYLKKYSDMMPQEASTKAKELLAKLHSEPKTTEELKDDLMIPLATQTSISVFDSVKMTFNGEQGQTIKQLINSHMIRRQMMALLKAPNGKRPLLAVSNDKSKISLCHVQNIYKYMDIPKKRISVSKLPSLSVPFQIMSMASNPCNEDLLAVCGLKECHVFSLSSAGAIVKQLSLPADLDTGNFIVKAIWLPGSSSNLAVVTADFIKVYWLNSDPISPAYYFLLPTGKIRDVTFTLESRTGSLSILVMSSNGSVYVQMVEPDCSAANGPFYITTTLEVNHPDMNNAGRVTNGGGASIYYSHCLQMIFLSYTNGLTLCSAFKPMESMITNNMMKIHLAKGKAGSPQPMVAWSEPEGHPGLVFAITQSTNNPLTIYVTPNSLAIQELKASAFTNPSSSSSKGGKVLDYLPIRYHNSHQKQLTSCFILCEDGSLKIFRANESTVGLWTNPALNPPSPFTLDKSSRKKTSKKSSKCGAQVAPDFFEHCSVSNDIEFGGNDLLEIYHKEMIKRRFETPAHYIACTRADGFKVEITNTCNKSVIVGVRVLVGGRQIPRIPKYMEILGRQKHINVDCQRWVDFPLTKSESRQAGQKFSITFGVSHDSDHITIIDSIKVFTQSKDKFGWSDDSPSAASVTIPSKTVETKASNQETEENVHTDQLLRVPPASTPVDKLLSCALTTLGNYLKCNGTTRVPMEPIEKSLCTLLRLIIPTSVREPALILLQEVKTSEVMNQIDKLRCEMISDWMNLRLHQLDPRTYQLILDWMTQIGNTRPANLRFINKQKSTDSQLLYWLVEQFTSLYGHRPYSGSLAPACCPGLQNVRATVSALVETIFIFLSEKPELIDDINKLCLDLLFSKDPTISFACKQAMVKVLKPPATFSKVPDTPAPPEMPKPIAVDTSAPPPRPATSRGPRDRQRAAEARAADLQQLLEQGQDLAGIEDLQLALALSFQDLEGEDDDDDDEEDDEADMEEDADDAALQELVAQLRQPDDIGLHEPTNTPSQANQAESDDEIPNFGGLLQNINVQTDNDSDNHLSAHSSIEGVQHVGITQAGLGEQDSILGTSTELSEGEICSKRELRQSIREALLREGVDKLKTSDGLTVIPYLQVMALLLGDLNTEDQKSSLESNLKDMLDALFDFNVAPEEFIERSKKTETQLVILRLFSVLMSRSHHQTGTVSGAILNGCAASLLIKKNAQDFFLQLLQLLLRYWTECNQDIETTTVLPFGTPQVSKIDMTPFFLRQYVKEHPNDIFEEFPQLQTEMVLRIVHQMKRVSDNNPDLSPIKLGDEWKRTLSEYMNTVKVPHIKRQVKKLLKYICGDDETYKQVRDYHTIDIHMKRVRSIAHKNGVTENPDMLNINSVKSTVSLSYPILLTMVDSLKVIQDIISSRNSNWQKYCFNHMDTTQLLMVLSLQITEGVTESLIDLISHVFSPMKSNAADAAGVKSLFSDLVSRLLQPVNQELLVEFFRMFLLQNNQTSIRKMVHSLVFNLYEQSDRMQKDILIESLWAHWQNLSSYGKKGGLYVDLVGYIIIKTDMSDDRRQEYIDGIAELLSTNNSQLSKHQNINIYNMLQEIVDLEGYYLEREPCMTCNDPEVNFSTIKLNNIKVDTKFSTTTQMIKMTGSHMISRIAIKITDIKKSKMIKTVKIFYSNKTVQSAVELKNRTTVWHPAKTLQLVASQNDVKFDFPVPITACNLMIEYSEFYENVQSNQENLQCPRCSATVAATPGICGNCGENVFQCHKCRSINYDERDPFLCNTCGFCKYAKFDVTLNAKPCCAVDAIDNDSDRTKTLNTVNNLLEKADKIFSDIQTNRATLERLLVQFSGTVQDTSSSSSGSNHVNKVIQQVAHKYCEESRKQFDELSKAMQKVYMCRRELVEFDRRQQTSFINVTPSSASVTSQLFLQEQFERAKTELQERRKLSNIQSRQQTRCYGCLTATVGHCVTILRALSNQMMTSSDETLISELVTHNLNSGPLHLRRDTMLLLCALTQKSVKGSRYLHNMLYERIKDAMMFCSTTISLSMNIRAEMMLLSSSISTNSETWEERLRIVIKLYTEALSSGKSHVIESVALRCLEIIRSQIVSGGKATSAKFKSLSVEEIAGFHITSQAPNINVQQWLDGQSTLDQWRTLHLTKTTGSGAENVVERKYWERWRRNVKTRRDDKIMINTRSWIATLLFSQSSQSARTVSAEILRSIAHQPERKQLLIDFLTKLLPQMPAAGLSASNFITLYQSLIEPREVKYYLVIKHNILPVIASVITSEIEKITHLEMTTLGSDLSLGWGLQNLINLLKNFLDDELIRNRYKNKLVGTVLDGYLSLKQLVVQRTKMIEKTQETLLALLETLTTGTEDETGQFMAVCVQTVNKYSPSDLRSPVFIFERLCSLIRPEEAGVGEFKMTLDKDPNQEDFLQGRMPGNPYSSKEAGLGPLMRDIKNKICTDCELVALLEDDSGMELLVNNKIISLDLEVAQVYRKVWFPAHENEPMRVVYRMRGLLGDATEDMVNTLSSTSSAPEDLEAVYKMAAVMKTCGGLEVMLKRLDYVHDYVRGKQLVTVLLKLFEFCVKLKINRQRLIKPELDTVSVMLRALNRALRAEQAVPAGGQTASPGQSMTEKLLQIMEIVLSEASILPEAEYTEFTKRCGDSDQLMLLLDRINSPFVRYNQPVLEALMRLIPFLACGEQEKMNTLIKYFTPYLNFGQFDHRREENDIIHLDCFCVITSGIKNNSNGSRLKQVMIDNHLLEKVVEYVTVQAPEIKTLLATDAAEWKEFVDRPALPYVLKLINGMCSGHETSQKIVGEAMIPILHKLEHLSTHSQIGTLSENVMETLKQNPEVSKRIDEIRSQTKTEKRRLAMAVREKQLLSIGMRTNNRGQVIVSSQVMQEAEAIQDESGLICSICREGYHNQPNKVLAVYTFTKRANLEQFELRSRKSMGLSTTSHMNIVHIDCHTSAVRLASTREEWDSAALHNANSRCNSMLPLWGPQVPDTGFATALARHNAYLTESTNLHDDSYTYTVHDIKLLLIKFSAEQPFSSDGTGGGRNSNMNLIPYQMLLALYVINNQRVSKSKFESLKQLIDQPVTKWVESSYEIDGPQYWIVLSMFVFDKQTWNEHKIKLVKRLLVTAQARSLHPGGCKKIEDKTVKDYSVYKQYLVLYAIIDQFYINVFKTVGSDVSWAESLMNYIRNNDMKLSESCEKLVSTYETEFLPCESLAEMFDVLGLLGDIPDPDDWLKNLLESIE